MLWCSSEPDPTKTTYSHVATWADRYLDSGVSLPMDIVDSAGSDYDSDDSRSSVETVHHSYSYVPSDVEVRSRHQAQIMCQVMPMCCWAVRTNIWIIFVCYRYQKWNQRPQSQWLLAERAQLRHRYEDVCLHFPQRYNGFLMHATSSASTDFCDLVACSKVDHSLFVCFLAKYDIVSGSKQFPKLHMSFCWGEFNQSVIYWVAQSTSQPPRLGTTDELRPSGQNWSHPLLCLWPNT